MSKKRNPVPEERWSTKASRATVKGSMAEMFWSAVMGLIFVVMFLLYAGNGLFN